MKIVQLKPKRGTLAGGSLALIGVLLNAQFVMASSSLTELSPELNDRYETLIAEIRCPKCLNTNIADSNAPISADLRNVVRELLVEGKSDQQIKEHLRNRYGSFILYDPPMSPQTLVLWVLPVVLVLIGVLVVLRLRSQTASIEIDAKDNERLELLKRREQT